MNADHPRRELADRTTRIGASGVGRADRAGVLPDLVRQASCGESAALGLVDSDGAVEHVLLSDEATPALAQWATEFLCDDRWRLGDVPGVVEDRVEVPGHGALAVLLSPVVHGDARVALACTVSPVLRSFTAVDRDVFAALLPWLGEVLSVRRRGEASEIERAVLDVRLRREITAAERERQRWARDLHDELLQSLGVLRFSLAASLEGPSAGDRNAITHAVAGLGEQIEGLRDLIDDLRPAVLDQLGLGPALVALVERTRRAAAVRVDVRLALGEDDGRLPDETEMMVYRLVQETLHNVVKHAKARTVRVAVARRFQRLELLVADDGVGFDTSALTGGAGLIGVGERVALARGQLEIRSRAGVGTTVEIALPL